MTIDGALDFGIPQAYYYQSPEFANGQVILSRILLERVG